MVEVRCEQLAHGYWALTAGRWVDARVVFRAGTRRAGVAACAVRLAMVPFSVEVAEQFLHSSHVLVHRLAQKVHHERLEHPAEEESGRVMASGGSNTISTGGAISISPSVRRLTGHPSCAPTDSIAMRRL